MPGVSGGSDTREALAEFERRCKAAGVPVTVQRRALFAALLARADHPTADQLFADVGPRLPGISLGTAYRTLDMLVELGLVVRVCHPGSAARYDAKTDRHHHLVCERCGAMVDLESEELSRLSLPDLSEVGFLVRDYSVHVRGECRGCAHPGPDRATNDPVRPSAAPLSDRGDPDPDPRREP